MSHHSDSPGRRLPSSLDRGASELGLSRRGRWSCGPARVSPSATSARRCAAPHAPDADSTAPGSGSRRCRASTASPDGRAADPSPLAQPRSPARQVPARPRRHRPPGRHCPHRRIVEAARQERRLPAVLTFDETAHQRPLNPFSGVCAASRFYTASVRSGRLPDNDGRADRGTLKVWSGRGESNPRHSAWEADVLPLNYARVWL